VPKDINTSSRYGEGMSRWRRSGSGSKWVITCKGFKFNEKLSERIVGLGPKQWVALDKVMFKDYTVWLRRETHCAGCLGISVVCSIDNGQIWYESLNSVNLESGG
jgi:hypothetical protein